MPGPEAGKERRPRPQRAAETVGEHHEPTLPQLLHGEVGPVVTEDARLPHGWLHDTSM